MDNTVVLSAIYFVAIILLLTFNELNYRRLKIRGEFTRKFAHFAATIAVIPFPYIFSSHWYVAVLAFIFFVVLAVTQYSKQLKSIHDIDRKSMGSYLLPLSIYLTFLLANMMDNKFLFILPMLILGICDPMAAIVGVGFQKNNHRIRLFGIDTGKSLFGSSAFFFTAFIVSLIALYFNRGSFQVETFGIALLVAAAGTVAEILSWRGSDNLSIPLGVAAVLLWVH